MCEIAFVVLTWNSEKFIEGCVRSILALDPAAYSGEVIVVDNGSKDRTAGIVRELARRFENRSGFACTLIALDRNYGTAYGRNRGISRALSRERLQYVCILDSDAEINADALGHLIRALEANPRCGIVGPRLRDSRGVGQCSGRNFPTVAEKFFKVCPSARLRDLGERMQSSIPPEGQGTVRVDYLLSACWMLRAEVFRRVGLLDERFFYAPEDVDFCLRCWKAGYEILYCYDAVIIHEWQRLSRKRLISWHNYVHVMGLARLFIKHRYLFHPNLNRGNSGEGRP